MTSATAFKPHKYQCPTCEEVIFSSYPGEFVSCLCNNCFVDETQHYIRVGGNAIPYEKENT